MLWFDALSKCFSVSGRRRAGRARCDLMLFQNAFQCRTHHQRQLLCCDLMLFQNAFQLNADFMTRLICCDLMLFQNAFQSTRDKEPNWEVVIWCSFKMLFSSNTRSTSCYLLWFDALSKCFSVRLGQLPIRLLLWFDALSKCFSVRSRRIVVSRTLWFDALSKCFSVQGGNSQMDCRVVIWCSFKMLFSAKSA